jgi:Protein of unknown function (DUF3052)
MAPMVPDRNPARDHPAGSAHRAYSCVVPEVVYTRPLIDKLGVAPGARVALIGIDDQVFRRALVERTQDITEGDPLPATNLVFLGLEDGAGLGRLPALRERIVANGAIWVVFRKGKAGTIRDIEVMAAGKSAGLVDNKVVSFSAERTSIRLVIPVALR